MTWAVRRATAEDVPSVAGVLAEAFDGDPWIAWVVAADGHRARVAALQSSLLEAVGLPHGEAWLAERADGSVAGAALWLLAHHPVPSVAWARVAAVEAELMGDRHTSALAAGRTTRHLRPGTAHHLLASLGVLASDRGHGVGASLLAPVLARADRDGVEAYLETSTEPNVRFYGHLGFSVTDHIELPDGGPPVWAMLRRPATAGRLPPRAST